MARLARMVAAGVQHHVTQRGDRRQTVFASVPMDETYLLAAARHVSCLISRCMIQRGNNCDTVFLVPKKIGSFRRRCTAGRRLRHCVGKERPGSAFRDGMRADCATPDVLDARRYRFAGFGYE